MTSIREQVSWVVEDKQVATEKAKAMIAGAVNRVQLHEELEPSLVPVNPNNYGGRWGYRRHSSIS